MVNPVRVLGQGIAYIGIGAVFLMTVIGAISVDLCILYWVSQNSRTLGESFICSLFLWDIMLARRSNLYENIGFSLLSSLILSAISVGLSFALGVPEFAVLLLAGWAGAFTIILVGAVIYGFGDLLEITWDAIVASLESSPTPTEDLARQQPQVAVQSTSDFGHRIELPKSEQYPAFPPPSYDDATKQEAANDPWGNEKHFNHPLSPAAPSAVAPTAPFAHDDAVVINSYKP